MDKYHNWQTRQKFYGFSAIFIFTFLLSGLLSLVFMREMNAGTTHVSLHWMPSVILAEELNRATSDFRIAESSHVISQEMETMIFYEKSMQQIASNIEQMFQEYRFELVSSEVDQQLILEAYDLWTKYLQIHEEIIRDSRSNDSLGAMALLSTESEAVFFQISDLFLELVHFNKEGAEQASGEGDAIFASSIVLVCVMIVVLLGVFLKFRSLIHEMEETQEKLEQAHTVAQLSSQAKSAFLANMSHEIRTPMNAISGMVDIILRESQQSQVGEYAQNIKRACANLLAMINDVLDISKIESGKLEIGETEYELSAVLTDVLAIACSRLEEKDLMFVTDFQQDLPQKLWGDSLRVRQILVNILNNAIKFTQEGHISLQVRGDYGQGQVKLTFTVRDTGSGIAQEDLDSMFETFQRVNSTKNRNIEGTGLGLAISKELCAIMGGEITVESEVGKGSIFSMTILQRYQDYCPLAQVTEQKSILILESRELYRKSLETACRQLGLTEIICCTLQSELHEALQEKEFDYIFTSALYHKKVQEMLVNQNLQGELVLMADNANIRSNYEQRSMLLPVHSLAIAQILKGEGQFQEDKTQFEYFQAPQCRLLVVDDNHVNLIVAEGLLKPYECVIDRAENGAEAVEKIKNNHYDLVFMDHMMPVMDGIDATIALRALEGEYYQKLPIIALTANALLGCEEMFLQEGMQDFLAKPINIQELHQVLEKWLPKNKQIPLNPEGNDGEKEITMKKQEEKGTLAEKLEIPGVDCDLGLQRVGGDFQTYVEILEVYYQDCLKRLPKVGEYFDKKDKKLYKIEVHALKSASASVGALAVSQKAEKLEHASNTEDELYLNQHHSEFMDEFKNLLEHIHISVQGFLPKGDHSEKTPGDSSFFQERLLQLKEALDNVDITLCEQFLADLFVFRWSELDTVALQQVKDLVSAYEYDAAIQKIEEIFQGNRAGKG